MSEAAAIAEVTQSTTGDPDTASHPIVVSTPEPTALVESDLLVEDVSIDGMCGVY